MKKTLNITVVIPYYFPFSGGQEMHTYFLVKYLKKFNVKIRIITTKTDNELKSYEKYNNVEIFRLKPLFDIYSNPFPMGLFNLLMRLDTDIFHIQGFWSFFANITTLVSKIRNIPIVFSFHGFQSTLFEKNILTRLIVYTYLFTIGKLMIRNLDIITCNHIQDKKILEKMGINERKIKILPSGLDTEIYDKISKKITPKLENYFISKYNISKPILLYVGRLIERKGCQFLLKALPSVIKKYPKLKCIIIGDGPQEKTFKELAIKLGLKNNTIFTGYLKPVSKELIFFYKIGDIQILPSSAESMPVSVMEGLYFGKNILITDLHFAKWISYNGKKLYIPLNPENIYDMSQKIINLLENKELREKLSKEGKEFIRENLSWNELAKLTYKLYLKRLNYS
ncbi:hypothetical protein LCGC14_2513650 [marine sediment metagenome]|uniref:Glycosyltransferase subfamily 4-like N-terminal domain-containing protein n=1 Tax=marine sediment metagenome TaxID=412755 RepID=A0A0F9AYB9_9ZZZZ